MSKKRKSMAQHQVKTQWYYWFWGAATVTVFCGQMYVGIGYRQMAEAVWSVVDVISAVREPFDDDKKLEDPTEVSRGQIKSIN